MSIDIATPEGASLVRAYLNGGSNNFFAEVDADGFIIVAGVTVRSFTIAQLNTIPKLNEVVVFSDYPGCFAIGDGSKTARQLNWLGKYTLTIDADYIASRVAPSETLKFFENTGIRDAEIKTIGNINYSDGESYLPLAAYFEFPAGIKIKWTFNTSQDNYPTVKITGVNTFYNLAGVNLGNRLQVMGGYEANGMIIDPLGPGQTVVMYAPNATYFTE